jgi:putative DNA primase/helicase
VRPRASRRVQQPCAKGNSWTLAGPREQAAVAEIVLQDKGLAMLFAARGIGKTHVALGIAYAVSTGGEFLRWRADRPRNVLYVDGEMPQQALQQRLRALMEASDQPPNEGAFRLLCMDRQELGVTINLANAKCQSLIDKHLGDAEFMVLDNMSTLMNSGVENDAESWNSMQDWLLQLRRRGVTVLVVHHAGRGGQARGTSKREDVLDTIIQLKHPEDYDPAEGARFEVHLTKARGLFGEDAEPFEAKLETDEEGAARWVCSDLKSEDADDIQAVLELSDAGKSTREIGRELSMSKSKVDRLLKKAKRSKKSRAAEQVELVDPEA